MPLELDIRASILCDDVRTEDNGKVILIGVYSGNVVVFQVPFAVPFYAWINFVPSELGRIAPSFRISFGGKIISTGHADIKVEGIEDFTFLVPRFVVQGEKEGELLVEMDQRDGNWQTLIKKQIIKGLKPTSLSSSESGPPI